MACGRASAQIPETIVDHSGNRWETTAEMQTRGHDNHPEATVEAIRGVLSNWVIRGYCTGADGNWNDTYWGQAIGARSLIRVIVDEADRRIITAYAHPVATESYESGNLSYFDDECETWEPQTPGLNYMGGDRELERLNRRRRLRNRRTRG